VNTRHVGRRGNLAVTVGIGLALFGGGGVASAETGSDSPSGSSSAQDARGAAAARAGDRATRSARPAARTAATAPGTARDESDRPPPAAAFPQPALPEPVAPVAGVPDLPAQEPTGEPTTEVPVVVGPAGNAIRVGPVAPAATIPDFPAEDSTDRPTAEVAVAATAGNTIQVGPVETARAGDVVNGFIEAGSTRGLGLEYALAEGPDRGAQIIVGGGGEFTLTPDPTVLAAGGSERFVIRISEKTQLQAFLEQVPLLGAVVPPIFTALRAAPVVGELLAPLIGYAVLAQVTVTYRNDDTTPVPPPVRSPAGWNLYSWQAQDAAVIEAIGRQQPGLVRWFVEMDRFLEDETQFLRPSRPWSWDADTEFDPFFAALAANDAKLIIALWNKYDWAKSMRACETCGWPKIEEYAAFVRDLDAEARKFGVSVIFEALNEPDLRWGSLNAATNIGATENFTGQWFAGLPQGWAEYRGGTGALWQQMHEVVESPFASGGIISLYTAEITLAQRLSGNYPTTAFSTQWIEATAPLVDYTSFHRYGLAEDTPNAYVEWVYNEWSLWRARKGYAVPFYIGEIGPTPTGSVGMTNAEASRMRAIHAALDADPRFEGAYLGMTAHVFSSTGAPNPWETSKGWWDPAFNVLDGAGRL